MKNGGEKPQGDMNRGKQGHGLMWFRQQVLTALHLVTSNF